MRLEAGQCPLFSLEAGLRSSGEGEVPDKIQDVQLNLNFNK